MNAASLPLRAPAESALFWAPRALTILFALFISLFALDVFDGGLIWWMAVVALLLHLTPTLAILLVLALAWRHEWVGALAYTALGVLYLATAWGRFHWSTYAMVSGPLLLIGILFFIGWLARIKPRVAP